MNTPSLKEDHISQIPALQMLVNLGYGEPTCLNLFNFLEPKPITP